ncbi:MAG: SDR family oxidoreductase [Myxococcales bacterium]|nr:SDR family oxidoreductase [Myxococcales bacterium]
MGTVLVTGASRGIGLDFARAWLERGAQVIAGCRAPNSASALSNLMQEYGDRLRIMQLDVTDERSVETMAGALGNQHIDLLINNAGILHVETLDNMDFASILEQFKVNALGALHVTRALLSNLRDGAKIINITSRMGSLDDNTSGGYYGYRMSKAALNMATRSMAVDLKSRGIVVVAMHPGMVQTDLTRGFGMLTPAESVAGMNQVIDKLTIEQSGLFLHYQGTTLPW